MDTLDAAQLVPGHSVVRGLSSGPNGAVVAAKQDGSGREVLVKTFRPAVLLDGDAERADRERRVAGFLAAARVQQQLAGSARHWAAVHDFGLLADAGVGNGAFYTTDEYPASAAWLVRSRVPLTAATLARVVAGVIAGVGEIRACCDRGHGNLTPGNVLLSGRDPRSARVLLTDPAADDGDGKADGSGDGSGDDESDDRWAVGALIYAMVTHKPVRRMTLLPAAPDSDWASLGRDADRWLSLCGRLMDRVPADRPSLAAVLAEVNAAAHRARRRRAVARAAGAVAVLAAVGLAAAAGYLHRHRPASPRPTVPAIGESPR